MIIKKLGHSCLVVEEGGDRIMIDPGWWNPGAENETGIHAIVATHQHEDHFDEKTVAKLLKGNPECKLYANEQLIERYKGTFSIQPIAEGDTIAVGSMSVDVYGKEHAFIREGVPIAVNTGLLINKRVFHPGDAYLVPPTPVEILALPVAAPWGKISETIEYLKDIQPKTVFPIHDGMQKIYGPYHSHPKAVAEELGITFIALLPGDSSDL